MSFFKILYCLLIFLNVGLFSVQTSAEAVVKARNIFSSQTGMSEVSGNSKFSFSFNTRYVQEELGITLNEVRNISDEIGRFYKSEKPDFALSEETKWLGLLYLKENNELIIHPKGSELHRVKKSFFKNPELVEAWKVVKDLPESVRKNTHNLDRLSNAMKQPGYDAFYFERLLKSKEDPQKFIDDFISQLGEDGKFIDEGLEDYYIKEYLPRKAREGKPPRDRSDWKEASDYMKYDSPTVRGNAFNRKAWNEKWYDYWEVYLDNGKYLDGYDPIEKLIVSRKATDLVDISETNFIKHLDELLEKYAPPRIIKSQKPGYEKLYNTPLPADAKLILEIPESNRSFYDIDRYIQLAQDKGITINFRPE